MSHSFPKSSAISNISDVVDNKITITWKNGNSYTYTLMNPEVFSTNFSEVLNSEQSIGRFINQQIQTNNLQLV